MHRRFRLGGGRGRSRRSCRTPTVALALRRFRRLPRSASGVSSGGRSQKPRSALVSAMAFCSWASSDIGFLLGQVVYIVETFVPRAMGQRGMGPRLREDAEGHPHPNLPPSKGEGVLRGCVPAYARTRRGTPIPTFPHQRGKRYCGGWVPAFARTRRGTPIPTFPHQRGKGYCGGCVPAYARTRRG